MTFSFPKARPIAAIAALTMTALTIGTTITPTSAYAAEGSYYRAELSAPAANGAPIAGGLVWKCAQTACAAPKGTSRPAIVCARLVKQVGQVANFSAGGKTLAADELARCNAN